MKTSAAKFCISLHKGGAGATNSHNLSAFYSLAIISQYSDKLSHVPMKLLEPKLCKN